VNYFYYDNNDLRKPKDTLSGRISMINSDYHILLGKTEFLKNSKYALRIDHSQKTIEVVNSLAVATATNPLSMLDSLSKVVDLKAKMISETRKDRSYRVNYLNSSINSCEFTISKQTYLIEELKLIFKKANKLRDDLHNSPVLKIRFTNYSYKIANDYLSEDKYITVKDSKVSLSPGYKNYKLINALN